MRKSLAALVVVVVVPAALALPTVAPASAAPRPVAPHTVTLPLTGVDRAALQSMRAATPAGSAAGTVAAAQPRPAVLTGELSTAPFQLVGVTWTGAAVPPGLQVSVRVKDDATGWGGWQSLALADLGPDVGSVDARQQRGGTEPLVANESSGVQVRVSTASGAVPPGLSLQLVDPGTSPADASIGAAGPASQAAAAESQPRIITRAAWGADESLRNGFAGYSPTIKVGFVHHTTTPNTYTSVAQAAQQIRAIYAYDTQGLHWSDIAYNFLVDKWGNVYEGRGGGVALPVIGAHTAGFNDDSFAVSALGCYDSTCSGGGAVPSSAMINGIASVLAWKLGLSYRDPLGSTTLVSSGITGTNIHHPAGQVVPMSTISGHRDVDATACPGNRLYPYLPTIRTLAATKMQAGFGDPHVSPSTGTYGSAATSVLASAVTTQTWQADVADVCRGGVVASLKGSASRTSPVSATWDGTAGGAPARPGPYSMTLSGRSAAGLALTWQGTYAVNAPPPGVEPAGSAVTGDGGFVPVAPARLLDTRSGVYANGPGGRVDVQVLGRGGVPASGVTAVALTVTATCPTTGGFVSVAPTGTGAPPSSNLNLRTGQTRSALVVVPVGAGGQVSLRNASGTTQLVVDVNGWFAATGGADLTPVSLVRAYDSRGAGGPLGTGQSRTIKLPAVAGVAPGNQVAVMANVTAYAPRSNGWLSVYPGGTAWPGTSSMNYAPGQDIDNSVVTKVVGGSVVVRNGGAPVDFSVDVVGVFTAPATLAGSRLEAITPVRVLDTRAAGGGGAFGPNQARAVTVAGGSTGVPAGAKAVLVTMTGIDHTLPTTFVAWPDDGSPIAQGAFIRLGAGDVRANTALVAVAPDGRILLRNVAGSTDVVIDVMGYFR